MDIKGDARPRINENNDLEGDRMEARREESVGRNGQWEGELRTGRGQSLRGGRVGGQREPHGEAQHRHPIRRENITTHDRHRGVGRGGAYQLQCGRDDGGLGGVDRSRDEVQPSQGGAQGEGRGRQGGPGSGRLTAERQNQPTRDQTVTTIGRNGLNPNAPPFNPQHCQRQWRQQTRNIPQTQYPTNKDRIHILFQTVLLHLTQSPLLNNNEWMTFCNKLDIHINKNNCRNL